MLNNFKQKKGFTLVELLVATAVFMSVMVVAVSSLIIIINTNRHTQSIKSVVDNVNFAIDSISRDLRNATFPETTSYQCLSSVDVGPDCPHGGTEIKADILTSTTATTTKYYRFVQNPCAGEGNIQKSYTGNSNAGCPSGWQSMTAPTSIVNISNMTFYVLGSGPNSYNLSTTTTTCGIRTQPRVIITAYGKIVSQNGETTKFTLQTTSSRRSRLTTPCNK